MKLAPPAWAASLRASRRAWIVAASSAWLLGSVFLPDRIPLYGLHVRNVRLESESKAVRLRIGRLKRERTAYRQVLAALDSDAVYWEAAARRAGMRKDGETVVGRSGKD